MLLLKCMHTHKHMCAPQTHFQTFCRYKAPLIRFSPVWWGLPTPTERWLSFDSEDHCARLWHFLWLQALIFVWGFIRATLLKGICFYPSKQLSKVIGSQTFFNKKNSGSWKLSAHSLELKKKSTRICLKTVTELVWQLRRDAVAEQSEII